MPSPSTNTNLRLRVFAGPNGSGKSTVINSVKNIKVNNKNIDFGIYINADDIARQLRAGLFTFHDYEITTNTKLSSSYNTVTRPDAMAAVVNSLGYYLSVFQPFPLNIMT